MVDELLITTQEKLKTLVVMHQHMGLQLPADNRAETPQTPAPGDGFGLPALRHKHWNLREQQLLIERLLNSLWAQVIGN